MSFLGDENRYQVMRILGRGTYGEVYECADLHNNGLRVAVKKLKTRNKKRVGIPATTIREMGILRSVSHPNIVSLLNLDQDDHGIYLVFEMM